MIFNRQGGEGGLYIFLGTSANCKMINFLKEFWDFMTERKKYWLFPILFVLALFGIIIVLSQGSAIAPFIYTVF